MCLKNIFTTFSGAAAAPAAFAGSSAPESTAHPGTGVAVSARRADREEKEYRTKSGCRLNHRLAGEEEVEEEVERVSSLLARLFCLAGFLLDILLLLQFELRPPLLCLSRTRFPHMMEGASAATFGVSDDG